MTRIECQVHPSTLVPRKPVRPAPTTGAETGLCDQPLQVAVAGHQAHTCNPSYSGSRNQEDGGSKPAWPNST
jgi:hypothetical protein